MRFRFDSPILSENRFHASRNFDKVFYAMKITLSKLIVSNFQIRQLELSLHEIF